VTQQGSGPDPPRWSDDAVAAPVGVLECLHQVGHTIGEAQWVRAQLSSKLVQYGEAFPHVRFGPSARQRLDPKCACADSGLAEDQEQANLPGPVDVCASAEFLREAP
jgi:hypothetical protein